MRIIKITVVIIFLLVSINFSSCNQNDGSSVSKNIDYKQEMREFVENISAYSKNINPNFAIIPQNGAELISTTGDDEGSPEMDYINAIDGIGQESLNYGYDADDQATPANETQWMRTFLDMAKDKGTVKVMVTDYCSTRSKMDNSYLVNNNNGYISFAADKRELDNIPNYPNPIYNKNLNSITNLQQAQNFLYLINPDSLYSSSQDFVDAVKNTNYDFIIMDFFYNKVAFTPTQINELKQKKDGGSRLLICYMSIGEAEDYRYYWQPDWKIGNPSFIEKENPNWEGNYVVRYWDPEWQKIIYGNNNSYLKKILDAGFDGVYLDIIDAFEQFED